MNQDNCTLVTILRNIAAKLIQCVLSLETKGTFENNAHARKLYEC